MANSDHKVWDNSRNTTGVPCEATQAVSHRTNRCHKSQTRSFSIAHFHVVSQSGGVSQWASYFEARQWCLAMVRLLLPCYISSFPWSTLSSEGMVCLRLLSCCLSLVDEHCRPIITSVRVLTDLVARNATTPLVVNSPPRRVTLLLAEFLAAGVIGFRSHASARLNLRSSPDRFICQWRQSCYFELGNGKSPCC